MAKGAAKQKTVKPTAAGDDSPTIVGVESTSTHSLKLYLSDGQEGDILACGQGSFDGNAAWRDLVLKALEATIQKVASFPPPAKEA